jgi:hypothetical protein
VCAQDDFCAVTVALPVGYHLHAETKLSALGINIRRNDSWLQAGTLTKVVKG